MTGIAAWPGRIERILHGIPPWRTGHGDTQFLDVT